MLGIKEPEIRYISDPAVGEGIQLTARVERMFDITTSALTLPPSEAGDKAEFKNGFKANLVELLAAIRLMRRYGGAIQKGIGPKGTKVPQISLDDLKKSVNGRSGLGEKGVSDWTTIFVKSVFNELTKPNGKHFPGLWLHSLKETNSVKTNVGIVYKLGYELKVANAQKVLKVTLKDVVLKDSFVPKPYKVPASDKDAGSRFRVLDKDTKKSLPPLPKMTKENTEVVDVPGKIRSSGSTTHREFRLGAMLLLPLIDPKDKRSPKDQISVDPLTIRDRTILNFYSRNREVVDALNLAYATLVAVPKTKSKATTLGYRSARGHAMRLTANRVWIDRTGKEYQSLSEVPQHVREFLEKLLHRKTVEEESDSEDETEEEEEAFQSSTEKQKTPPKE
jgi:hypothetical protein